MRDCDGSCRSRAGLCACGAMKDGVLQDGRSVTLSVMLKDSASALGDRKDLAMMTDSEIRTMRDSVRGMPLDKAAALPIYDGVRGAFASGMPAERYHALIDGAGPFTPTDDVHRAEAARDHMKEQLSNAWKGQPVNDNRAPSLHFARDGRPLAQLSDSERAREEMIARQSGAWRN